MKRSAVQGALFAGENLVPEVPEPRRNKPAPPPIGPEVASVHRAVGIPNVFVGEYPNESAIIRERSRGQGIRLYGTMLKTDADLAGFYKDLEDDVLHYPRRIIPFSDAAEHQEHARFAKFALDRLLAISNSYRHALTAYPWGFAVFEKTYEVIERGEWAGAVVIAALLDRPHTWFSFDPDRNLLFKTNRNPFPGEQVDPEKFLVVQFGSNSSPWGDPSLDYVYLPWRLKHHLIKNQALWFEKWASPAPVAEYDWSPGSKNNDKFKAAALDVLMAWQNDQALALPKGTSLRLMESIRSGTVSYEGGIAQLTEMESRLVTGQILTSMGGDPGSFALGKVHEKRAANKTEMLATWLGEVWSRLVIREIIVRNYGRQDGYPRLRIMAKSPASRQAEATLVQQYQANGHELSRSFYDDAFDIVAPSGPDDVLAPSLTTKPGQVLPVTTGLADPEDLTRVKVALARVPALHRSALERATAKRDALDRVASTAAAKARPAIRKVVRSVASAVRDRSALRKVRRSHVHKALKGAAGVKDLGQALDGMLTAPARMHFGAYDGIELSIAGAEDWTDSAKLALALLLFGIAEHVGDALDEAPDDQAPGAFADSLTAPDGPATDQVFANLFEGTHSTNVASISTASFREQLADPAFRREFPYVMIVVTNPAARLEHRVMDGFILSAEEARYSPFLAPFGFGCDCQNVPISAAEARAMGLTGSAPVGSLDQFLRGNGATASPRGGYVTPDGRIFRPGAAEGFAPAYQSTDLLVQLDALRAKAEELRAKDPEAWAAMHSWVQDLFGYDVLRKDPPSVP